MRSLLLFLFMGLFAGQSLAEDSRELVVLPERMQVHMLANMRDHLDALAEASELIAEEQWDRAAGLIESRIGMSSLEAHGAEHMAGFMPAPMRAMGTEMHRAASRLARSIEEAQAPLIFRNQARVMASCNACHAQYRVK